MAIDTPKGGAAAGGTPLHARLDLVLEEMRGVFARLPADTLATLAREITEARTVQLYGVGRVGLVLQGFAMRLAHLGVGSHFVGQLAAPPVGSGDLLLVGLALGTLPTCDAMIASARKAGARVLVVSARPQVVKGADRIIELPAQTMGDPMTSVLALGSPFELALWLLCDLAVAELMVVLGQSNADLGRRHTNLL
jgi:6-phospho-3-hexuloisomerase